MVGVILPALRTLLVTLSGTSLRLVSRSSFASRPAIPVAAVAVAAEEEDLPALAPAADDEP